MAGIKLFQPTGVGVLNDAGAQHPPPVEIDVGQICHLSFVGGSTSIYRWFLSKPSSSASVLSSGSSAGPSFMPDVDGGSYSLSLFDSGENEYILDIVTPTTGIGGSSGGGTTVTTTIEDYATVRSSSFLGGAPPASIVVMRRETVGDGGEGTFVYLEGDSATEDNDGTVLVDSDGNRYKRVYGSDVDAAWFGVVPSTVGAPIDVSSAMQAAIDATPSGGTLRVRACNSTDAAGLRYRLKSTTASTSQGEYALHVNKPITIAGDTAFYNTGATTGAGVTFQCDTGIGGIFVQGSGGGEDGRFTTLRDLAFFSTTGGDDCHGIYAEGSVRIIRCAVLLFPGCGVFVNGDGGGHNANQCLVDNLVVNKNRDHGWFITGQESNGNNFAGINANENGGVGIWDSSFLGNNYVGCQVAINGSDAIGQGPDGEPLGYKTDGGENASVFTGCYTEDSDYHEFGGSTVWIGARVGAGQVAGGGGTYVHPSASFGLGFRAPDLDTGGGSFFIEAIIAPTDGGHTIMSFKLPSLAQGGSRDRDNYRFGVAPLQIEDATAEGYSFYFANSADFQPFVMTSEAFYRGAGRMLFRNGFMMKNFVGSTASKYRFLAEEPPSQMPGPGSLELGDSFDYLAPADGSPKGAVCTRVGNGTWHAAWEALTPYTLGQIRQPTADNGHQYTVTTAGTSGASEPSFNTGTGSTTSDGSVVWTESGVPSKWTPYGLVTEFVGLSGTLTPESAVAAPVSTLFARRDGASSEALYVKASGAGNTGWENVWTAPREATVQRIQRGQPAFADPTVWAVDEYSRVVCNTATGDAAHFQLELPNGATLTEVEFTVIGGGNADLPGTMPRFRVRRLSLVDNSTSSSSDAVDSSANVGVYNAVHTIALTGLSFSVNQSFKFTVEFVSESGADAVTGFTIIGFKTTCTVTGPPDRGAA